MKSRNISFSALLILLVFLFISITSNAKAEYAFNDPEVPDESKEAATMVFQALSIWFKSLEGLERKDVNQAKEIKGQMLGLIKEVIKKQIIIKEKTSKKLIHKYKIPSERLPIIMRDFERLKIPFPNSKKDLADIAIQELQFFEKFLRTVDFTQDPSKNRNQIRLMINKIWRLVVLGVQVSEISASVK